MKLLAIAKNGYAAVFVISAKNRRNMAIKPATALSHDCCAGYRKCVAVPFGIYELAQNAGYVTVGVSTNTSEFAVNCLESWWRLHGQSIYPHGDRLLVFADGGGANGYNLRTWKMDL